MLGTVNKKNSLNLRGLKIKNNIFISKNDYKSNLIPCAKGSLGV